MSVTALISGSSTAATLAATAYLVNPFQMITMATGYNFTNPDSHITRVKIIQETSSSNLEVSHIQTYFLNWRQLSLDLFSGSRGFTSEEATMHANALKAVSQVKGKRFEL